MQNVCAEVWDKPRHCTAMGWSLIYPKKSFFSKYLITPQEFKLDYFMLTQVSEEVFDPCISYVRLWGSNCIVCSRQGVHDVQ